MNSARYLGRCLSVSALVVGAGFGICAAEQRKPSDRVDKPSDIPPWKRILKGEDAKKAAELEKHIVELQETGNYVEAIVPTEELLALRRRVQGTDHHEAIDVKWGLEVLRTVARLPKEQRAEWRLTLIAAKKAEQQEAQGRYAEALPSVRNLLDLRRKVLGEEHPHTANGYNNAAVNLGAQGRYAEAERLSRTALTIHERVLGNSHPSTAISYNNVAFNLRDQGKYAEAELLVRKALAIFQSVLGEEHPHTAQSYNNVAFMLQHQGKYAPAEPLFHTALHLRQKALGKYHPHTASSYNNIAFNLHAQGKYAEAEPFIHSALAARRIMFGEQHTETATSYNNLASILHAQERYAEAEPLYRRALETFQKLLGVEHPDTALSYSNVAFSMNARGEYLDAEPLYRKALAIFHEAFGEEHPHTALIYSNLAINLEYQGRHAEAELLARKALAIRRRALGDENLQTGHSYNNVAFNLIAQGKYADAEPLASAAVASLEAARLRAGGSGLERAGFQRYSPRLVWAIALLRTGRPAQACQVLEGHFGRGLLDDFSARHLRIVGAEGLKEIDALNAHLNRIDRQVTNLLGGKGGLEVNRDKFDSLALERKSAETKLAQLAARLQQRDIYDVATIQSRLPIGAAVIAWLDGDPLPKAARPRGEHWAFLLKREGEPLVMKLTGSGQDNEWTNNDAELLSDVAALLRRAPRRVGDVDDLCRKLARQRLGPLEPHLKGVRHLIILPSEAMRGIPVEALTDRYVVSYAPSGTMLARIIEKRPAKPLLTRLLALGDPVFRPAEKRQELPAPPDHGLLLIQVQPGGIAAAAGLRFGDVLLQYAGQKLIRLEDQLLAAEGDEIPLQVWRDGQIFEVKVKSGRLGVAVARIPAAEAILSTREADQLLARVTRGPTMTPLPATRREINAIAAIFPEAKKLLGADASREKLAALERDLGQYDVLHFATHGSVDPQVALDSALNLSQTDGDNGRLTALHMKDHWPLKAELVVLSACDTGLGRRAIGEGYLGFSQALFLAGARSLVLSLWKVDDVATSLLMVRFYQNLRGKREGLKEPMTKVLALDEAKRWLRTLPGKDADALRSNLTRGLRLATGPSRDKVDTKAPYAHPYFWSAFILLGDPN